MEYLNEIMWLLLWPIVIFLSYKVSMRNTLKFDKKISKQ